MRDRFDPQSQPQPQAERSASELRQLETEMEEMRQTLQAQSVRLDEVLRAYSRLQQDKDDFRRRAEREKERVLEIERGNVGLALLEAVDQLDLTLQTVPTSAASSSPPSAEPRGSAHPRWFLLRHVEQAGIARLSAVGTPSRSRAARRRRPCRWRSGAGWTGGGRDSAGYQQGERILRPARVSVGRLASPGKSGARNSHAGKN